MIVALRHLPERRSYGFAGQVAGLTTKCPARNSDGDRVPCVFLPEELEQSIAQQVLDRAPGWK